MSKVLNKEKGQGVGNAFMGAADVLGTGVDALFGGAASDDFEIVVNLDDVEIRAQHRSELEDEANSLQDLADNATPSGDDLVSILGTNPSELAGKRNASRPMALTLLPSLILYGGALWHIVWPG